MSNEKIEIKWGGNAFKGEQKQNFFGNHHAGKNDKGVFEKKKGVGDLLNEGKFKPLPKFSVDFPLVDCNIPINVPGQFIHDVAVAELKIGGALGAYQGVQFSDLYLGDFNLKIDHSGFCAALKINPFQFEPVKVNTPLLELAKTWEPANALTFALKNKGYDLDKLLVSEIQFKGPSGEVALNVGEKIGGALGGSLAGISVTLGYFGENHSLALTCGLSAGVKVARGCGEVIAKNGNQGIQMTNNVAVGIWEVKATYAYHHENNNLNYVNNTNDFVIDALYGEGSIMKEKNALTLLELFNQNKKQATNSTQKAFNRKSLQNENMLSSIQEGDNANREKIVAVVSYIDDLYADVKQLHTHMLEQKKKQSQLETQAKVLANFQGVMDGFSALAHIGSISGNKSIQTVGTVGMAVTQGALGVAQLTGSFGLAAVTGAAMLTPVGAVIGGVLILASLFMKNKGDSTGKALQAISKQIGQVHKDMMEGFGIVIDNQKLTIDLITQGFKGIDETLYQVVMNQRFMIEELSGIDFKLDEIQATLQEITIETNKQYLKKMDDRLELLLLNHEEGMMPDETKQINKMLIAIDRQLEFSLNTSCKGLENKGNNLPGWFHVHKLTGLFCKSEFIHFDFNLRPVANVIWWQDVVNYYFQMLPFLGGMNQHTQALIEQIAQSIQNTAESTASFLEKASSITFFKAFFNHYMDQFKEQQRQADALLSHLIPASKQYRENALNQVLALNQQEGVSCLSPIKMSFMQSSQVTTSSALPAATLLQEKVKEYNACLKEFKTYASILFSLFSGERDVQSLLKSLQPIDPGYYAYRALTGTHNDAHYIYLEGPVDNQFNVPTLSDKDIELLHANVKKNADNIINQIDCMGILTKIGCLFSNEIPIPTVINKPSVTQGNRLFSASKKQKSCNLVQFKDYASKADLDDAWYSDDEINNLLISYFALNKNIYLFTAILGTNGLPGTTLAIELQKYKNQRNLSLRENRSIENQVVVPVNLDGMHWVLILIKFAKMTSEITQVVYVDPFGRDIPNELKNVFLHENGCKNENLHSSSVRLQEDGYNCGPWIVAIAEHLIMQEEAAQFAGIAFDHNQSLLELNGLSIGDKRREQQAQLKLIREFETNENALHADLNQTKLR